MFLELLVKIFENINHSANKCERAGWVVCDFQILETSAFSANPFYLAKTSGQREIFLISQENVQV
jgi:hypothetical protein